MDTRWLRRCWVELSGGIERVIKQDDGLSVFADLAQLTDILGCVGVSRTFRCGAR